MGQTVFICSAAEIAATLDADGKLEGLPFMPEMARHCGTPARIHRHVDKTCVEGQGMRRMTSTVLLEGLRCDGSAHDGCQRNCMFFWKEAWLRPAYETGVVESKPDLRALPERSLLDLPTRRGDGYCCQSTELLTATQSMSRWSLGPFLREIRRGELSVPGFMQILYRTSFDRLRSLLGLRKVGAMAGSRRGNARGHLGLQPGDWVEVLSYAEIQATLDPNGKNCGLSFEPAMSEYIGRRFQVERPVERIILEQTGKMVSLTHTVTVKGVTCQGPCSKNCPRNNDLYWRECWLRRV